MPRHQSPAAQDEILRDLRKRVEDLERRSRPTETESPIKAYVQTARAFNLDTLAANPGGAGTHTYQAATWNTGGDIYFAGRDASSFFGTHLRTDSSQMVHILRPCIVAVTASARFPANSVGLRGLRVTPTTAAGDAVLPAIADSQVFVILSYQMWATTVAPVRVYVHQSSGSTLTSVIVSVQMTVLAAW